MKGKKINNGFTLTEFLISLLIATILIASIMPLITKKTSPKNIESPIPAGTIIAYAGTSIPDGWLLCNGKSISRTTYSKLFSAIGTTFGTGRDSTTFKLPDMRGLFIRGWDSTRNIDTDNSRRFGSIQAASIPEHKHSVSVDVNTISSAPYLSATDTTYTIAKGGTSETSASGIGTDNRPINIALNYIIKY